MSHDLQSNESVMNERRSSGGDRPGVERRQFADGRSELSPEARELADAVDAYKRTHRRRFITHEEMVSVIKSLGYHK
jgi:NTP pyrophosphatase (non-canonical NTP hydrolase)